MDVTSEPVIARRLLVGGRVQGVGFRPFIYRLAHRHGLSGWVRNLAGQVEILAQGSPDALRRFADGVLDEAPPLARPELLVSAEEQATAPAGFAILPSDASQPPAIHVPPDQFTCDDCLSELADPSDRRHGYPFINCTQCGPRYTLITALPYDRPNTTMAAFPMCDECAAEYGDPADRRFHAEPVACPVCGPRLWFVGPDAGSDALEAAVTALHAGAVLAIKGIGGYHLVCDALNPDAVAALRRRKKRPHKPLALMLPDDGLVTLHALACPTEAEIARLTDPMRPIVLVRRRRDSGMPEALTSSHVTHEGIDAGRCGSNEQERTAQWGSDAAVHTPRPGRGSGEDSREQSTQPQTFFAAGQSRAFHHGRNVPANASTLYAPTNELDRFGHDVPGGLRIPPGCALAPGIDEIGVMLPYSPLHHLLIGRFGRPLVATSANPSGEPVLTDNDEVTSRLGHVVDGYLHHDRPIARPADDPVYRVIAGKPRPIRLGRGNAPLELTLPFPLSHPMLALGGQMKATIALGWDNRAVVSPHLGEMDTPRAIALLRSTAAELQALYGVRAEILCCDAHPGYASARRAREWGLPVQPVLHHLAHASALAAEFPPEGDWIVFAWDGAGLGADGSIWGGEALVGTPGHWQRRASFRPFSLLGGDKAARQPWRSALALAWESGGDWEPQERPAKDLLFQAWRRGVNCPRSSSVGRLFDATAALLGLVSEASFEGQAPMYLEAAAAGGSCREAVSLGLARDTDGLWRTDWAPLLPELLDPGRTVADRAMLFHSTMAAALLVQAEMLRAETGITRLGLTGGVFQNRLLAETVMNRANEAGFAVFLPERLPCNDAGLSFGQLIEAAACP
jgi:hydrogenase maturation factor HypF (carbamoyltransferase family)